MGNDAKAEKVVQHGTWALNKGCSIGFMEMLWGGTTCSLAEASQKLLEEHWEEVMEECKAYLPHSASGDIQPNAGHLNGNYQRSELHASIQVDW